MRRGSPDLRRILVAYTVNELGTWFGYIALAVAVYDHTHSAIAIAALFLCGRCVPAVLVPPLVARVEASQRRGELSGLYAVEAVATLALAMLVFHFWLPGVLVLVAVDGTAALAAKALLRAVAARTGADSEDLLASGDADREVRERRANAALNLSFSATVAIGPALAGVLVATAGPSWALVVDAVSFAACAVMLLDARSYIEEMSTASIRNRIADAWGYVKAAPMLRSVLMAETFALIFFTATVPIEVIYSKSVLHGGDAGYGAFTAAWGAGMVVGGLVFSRSLRKPLPVLLAASTAVIGLAYLGFSAAPNIGLACAAAVVGGIGNGVQWAALIGAVQRFTPPRLHGQLMGAVESMAAMCAAIGFSAGGIVITVASPRLAYLLAGAAILLLTSAFASLARATATDEVPSGAKMRSAEHPETRSEPSDLAQWDPRVGELSKATSQIGR